MQKLTSDESNEKIQVTVFKKLIEPIDAFLAEQEEKLPKHHNQKYGYYDFFVLLAYYFTSGVSSLKLLVNGLLNKGLLSEALNLRKVPYSTCNEAFDRHPIDLFRSVFQHLIQTLHMKSIPELMAFGTLCCIDGSLFPVISSMLWANYTSTHNAVKIHLFFELNRMIAVNILVTAGNSNERKVLIKMLTAGVTYIADRGYGAFYVYHEIIQAKAHFIIRVKKNLLFVVQKSLTVQLPTSVQHIFRKVTDELIRCTNDKHAHIYRLVRFYIGSEAYYVLTDRQDLTTFQIIMLYAYRWQIELMFRYLKRTMNGIHLIKQNEQGINIQFYVILIVALLELRLKQETMDKVAAKNATEEKKPTDKREEGNLESSIAEQMEENLTPNCRKFIEILGKKVEKYWKIGIYWLTALRNILAAPFDENAIELLGGT